MLWLWAIQLKRKLTTEWSAGQKRIQQFEYVPGGRMHGHRGVEYSQAMWYLRREVQRSGCSRPFMGRLDSICGLFESCMYSYRINGWQISGVGLVAIKPYQASCCVDRPPVITLILRVIFKSPCPWRYLFNGGFEQNYRWGTNQSIVVFLGLTVSCLMAIISKSSSRKNISITKLSSNRFISWQRVSSKPPNFMISVISYFPRQSMSIIAPLSKEPASVHFKCRQIQEDLLVKKPILIYWSTLSLAEYKADQPEILMSKHTMLYANAGTCGLVLRFIEIDQELMINIG